MENPNEILCYDKFKLGRVGKTFNETLKVLEMTGTPMRRIDAENYNANKADSGVMFVLNEEATANFKVYEKERDAKKLASKKAKTEGAKEILGQLINDAVTTVAEKSVKTKTKEV